MRAILTPPRLLSLTTPVVSSTLVDVFGGLAVGLDSGAASTTLTLAKLVAVCNYEAIRCNLYHQVEEYMQFD